MYLEYQQVPDHARVWMYQASRELSDMEVEVIHQTGEQFISGWKTHGQEIQGSIRVFHHRFVAIMADEQVNAPSGCAIDSSVALIRELENQLNTAQNPVTFFDRTNIAFINDGEVVVYPLKKVKGYIEEGEITKDMLTFNNLVTDKSELENKWIIPVKDSWLARYFN
jgi:hypothetical protein